MTRTQQVEVSQDSIMRVQAYANGNMLANCEECGQPIPIELSLCSRCHNAHND